MKLAMTATSVTVSLSSEERALIASKTTATRFGFEWRDDTHSIRIHPSTARSGTSGLGEIGLQWKRINLPFRGKRLPHFGSTAASSFVYDNRDGFIGTMPDEAHRKTEIKRKKPLSSPPSLNGEHRVVLDFIQKLRYHRDALNEMRSRHPENLTFKVKDDGVLGFEFLADE